MSTKEKISFYAALNSFLTKTFVIQGNYEVVDSSIYDLGIRISIKDIPLSLILDLSTLYNKHSIVSKLCFSDDCTTIYFYTLK